jgi:hypothetical protein
VFMRVKGFRVVSMGMNCTGVVLVGVNCMC